MAEPTYPAARENGRLLSDAETAAANTTAAPSDAKAAVVRQQGSAALYIYAVGTNASSSGEVKVVFEAAPNAEPTADDWHEVKNPDGSALEFTAALSGTTEDKVVYPIDLRGLKRVRIKSIQNTDATYDATVNAHLGMCDNGRLN